jgi:hypothetical protein
MNARINRSHRTLTTIGGARIRAPIVVVMGVRFRTHGRRNR